MSDPTSFVIPAGGTGIGVPAGGNEGQSLVKLSSDNYDTGWATIAGGSGGSPNLDGGSADSNYGAISPVDGGSA
jgi:hypothetical protein